MRTRRSWDLQGALAGLASIVLLTACVHAPADAPPFDPGFEGPGRLLVLFERVDGRSALWTFDAAGARELPVDAVREARWATRERIVAMVEVPAREEFRLPATRLLLVDARSGAALPIGEEGRHYDAEPSPDGAWLLVGAEIEGVGDSNLEVWALEGEPERVGLRAQSLEEPRWRGDGMALAASVVMADPETDDATGGSFGGTSFTWPRLHRMRRDLGDPELLFDGARPGSYAPGGSLALWWDERGLFARQRRGLVRCVLDADLCTRVFAPGPDRRIVDGRPVGRAQAWLTSVAIDGDFERREPDRLHRVDLETGVGETTALPPGVGILDLDWIAD